MNRVFTLPDGSVVEYCRSGRCAGPSGVGGQHYGTTYLYYRVNGGKWHSCPFALRNENKFAEWVACCENLSDFMSAETL
jgi:hypothetical protein